MEHTGPIAQTRGHKKQLLEHLSCSFVCPCVVQQVMRLERYLDGDVHPLQVILAAERQLRRQYKNRIEDETKTLNLNKRESRMLVFPSRAEMLHVVLPLSKVVSTVYYSSSCTKDTDVTSFYQVAGKTKLKQKRWDGKTLLKNEANLPLLLRASGGNK